MSRVSDRGPAFYRRPGPTRTPGRTFLIVTEGKETEPNYFEFLRTKLHLTTAQVKVIHPEATDPKRLTEEAIQLAQKRRRESKKGDGVAYDEVRVVYDLEKPNDERRRLHRNQRSKQKAHEIRVATSDPCFEYWLLLHFRYTTSPFFDSNAVIKQLKQYLPRYEKAAAVPPQVFDLTAKAIEHAKLCRRHHHTCNGSGNPGTDVDILVATLDAAASPAYRIPNLGSKGRKQG
jgi:hypothetical protein